MRFLWLTIFASASAWATHPPPEPVKPAQQQSQQQEQDQDQQQTQSANAQQSQTTTATGGSNTNSTSVNVESERQAPSTFVGAASPSAPCYAVNGFNLGVPGAGGGRFKSKLDSDCVIRERARLLIEAGRADLAVALLYPDAPPAQRTDTAVVCQEHTDRALAECGVTK